MNELKTETLSHEDTVKRDRCLRIGRKIRNEIAKKMFAKKYADFLVTSNQKQRCQCDECKVMKVMTNV